MATQENKAADTKAEENPTISEGESKFISFSNA